jgi:hypothetical protein
MRRLRGEDVLPYMDNTAIEHPPEKRWIECDPEFYLNDTLHRLPKKSVKLDWIGQMKAVIEGNNEEMLQMMAAAERALSPQNPNKVKEKELFRNNEILIHEKGKGKDVVCGKGKGKEFVHMNEFVNDFTSAVPPSLLPSTTSSAAIGLLDEDVQMAIAIELSRKKSRVEYNDKEGEEEDEEAGPSGSNGDNYEVAKRLRLEDYESSASPSSSTNIHIHTEPAENLVSQDDVKDGDEGEPEDFKIVKERVTKYNETIDKNEENITRNNMESNNKAENNEENPLFLLVEAAFGGFVSISMY